MSLFTSHSSLLKMKEVVKNIKKKKKILLYEFGLREKEDNDQHF